MRSLPYWRLSAFYFLYFSALGSLLPYWNLYLESLGFNAVQIGQLAAVMVGTKIVAPNIWGWIADQSGRRLSLIRSASLMASLAFLAMLLDTGFIWMASVTLVFSFFWNASLPQFEAVTLSYLKSDPYGYSQVRVWGSIGFVVTVIGVGWLLESLDISVLPLVVALLMWGIWVASMLVPREQVSGSESAASSLGVILRKTEVIAFLIVSCLVQLAHGPYYVFYSIFLEHHGYSHGQIGQLWSLGVIAEVMLFFSMHRCLAKFSLRVILLASIMAGVLRWALIAFFADHLPTLVFAQVLHAATFGSMHVAAIHLVHAYFPSGSHGRGQALYSSMSFGLGGMLGSLVSGTLWDELGARQVFCGASAVCLLALVIAWVWVRTNEGED